MTFAFKPSPRSRLHADRATANGRPAVWLSLHGTDGRGAAVFIDVDHLEEVVAGLRDMARQAGGQTPGSTCMCGHRKDQHVIVSGRLLCDSCDPDDTTAPTCTGYDEPVGTATEQERAEGAGHAFSVAERQFLTFALDLAADRMASRSDEFTDEDQAALDRFRSMSTGETGGPAPEPVTLRLQVGDEQAFGDMIRRIVGNGPTGSAE